MSEIVRKHGVKKGAVIYLQQSDEDYKERWTVVKLYPNVVLLQNGRGIKMCPNYAKLRELTRRQKIVKKAEETKFDTDKPHMRKLSKKFRKLTEMQVAFCEEYVRNGENGKEALRKAGYKTILPGVVKGMMQNELIAECIEELKKNGKQAES